MPRVNKAALAEFLGFSERAITEWQDEGLPIARRAELRGQAHEYDTGAVVAWMLERAERRARSGNPKDDLYRSQVRLNELKIAETEGRLVDLAGIEAGLARMVALARSRLLEIPVASVDRLRSAATAAEATEILSAEILAALADLAESAQGGGEPS